MIYKTGQRDHERGIALVSLAIIVVVAGLLAAAAFQLWNIESQEKKIEIRENNLDAVRIALGRFVAEPIDEDGDGKYEKRSRLPCPAAADLPNDSAGFGVEWRNPGMNRCVSGPGVVEVVGTNGQSVFIGSVPVKALGLESYRSLDENGFRFTYAVSGNLAGANGVLNDADAKGGITIVNEFVVEKWGYDPARQAKVITERRVVKQTDPDVSFTIVSHGADGRGAYTDLGEVFGGADCVGEAATKDSENCDNDAVFWNALRSEGTSEEALPQYFDDRVAFTYVDDIDDKWWNTYYNELNGRYSYRDIVNVNGNNDQICTDEEIEEDGCTNVVCIGALCDPAKDFDSGDPNTVDTDTDANLALRVSAAREDDNDPSLIFSIEINSVNVTDEKGNLYARKGVETDKDIIAEGDIITQAKQGGDANTASNNLKVDDSSGNVISGKDVIAKGNTNFSSTVKADGANIIAETGDIKAQNNKDVIAKGGVTDGLNRVIAVQGDISAPQGDVLAQKCSDPDCKALGNIPGEGDVHANRDVIARGSNGSSDGTVTAREDIVTQSNVEAPNGCAIAGHPHYNADWCGEDAGQSVQNSDAITAGNNVDAADEFWASSFKYEGGSINGDDGQFVSRPGGPGAGDNIRCPDGEAIFKISGQRPRCRKADFSVGCPSGEYAIWAFDEGAPRCMPLSDLPIKDGVCRNGEYLYGVKGSDAQVFKCHQIDVELSGLNVTCPYEEIPVLKAAAPVQEILTAINFNQTLQNHQETCMNFTEFASLYVGVCSERGEFFVGTKKDRRGQVVPDCRSFTTLVQDLRHQCESDEGYLEIIKTNVAGKLEIRCSQEDDIARHFTNRCENEDEILVDFDKDNNPVCKTLEELALITEGHHECGTENGVQKVARIIRKEEGKPLEFECIVPEDAKIFMQSQCTRDEIVANIAATGEVVCVPQFKPSQLTSACPAGQAAYALANGEVVCKNQIDLNLACAADQIITGISSGRPVCRPQVTVLAAQDCPAGEVALGLQNGNLICGLEGLDIVVVSNRNRGPGVKTVDVNCPAGYIRMDCAGARHHGLLDRGIEERNGYIGEAPRAGHACEAAADHYDNKGYSTVWAVCLRSEGNEEFPVCGTVQDNGPFYTLPANLAAATVLLDPAPGKLSTADIIVSSVGGDKVWYSDGLGVRSSRTTQADKVYESLEQLDVFFAKPATNVTLQIADAGDHDTGKAFEVVVHYNDASSEVKTYRPNANHYEINIAGGGKIIQSLELKGGIPNLMHNEDYLGNYSDLSWFLKDVQATYSAQTLCSVGTASAVTDSGSGQFVWTCTSGASVANCSVPKIAPTAGSCGSAHGTQVASAPTTNLCAVTEDVPEVLYYKDPTNRNPVGRYEWVCTGSDGGRSDVCEATEAPAVVAVNAQCGVSGNARTQPSGNGTLCQPGTFSSVTPVVSVGESWTWTCNGINGGAVANCSVGITKDGDCGSANTQTYASAPTSNLCDFTSSAASVTSTADGWSWTCTGQNGGNNQTCLASKPAPRPQPQCGGAHEAGPFGDWPDVMAAGFCAKGNVGAPRIAGGKFLWSCNLNGGDQDVADSVSCSASVVVPPKSGDCGSAEGVRSQGKPNANLCDFTTARVTSVTSEGNEWVWQCMGEPGAASPICRAPKPEVKAGVCGSADNGSFPTAPTSNLCAFTSIAAVAKLNGNTWSWTCTGENGGANDNCTATKPAERQPELPVCAGFNPIEGGNIPSAPPGGTEIGLQGEIFPPSLNTVQGLRYGHMESSYIWASNADLNQRKGGLPAGSGLTFDQKFWHWVVAEYEWRGDVDKWAKDGTIVTRATPFYWVRSSCSSNPATNTMQKSAYHKFPNTDIALQMEADGGDMEIAHACMERLRREYEYRLPSDPVVKVDVTPGYRVINGSAYYALMGEYGTPLNRTLAASGLPSHLCAVGTPSPISDADGAYRWTCSNEGQTIQCGVNKLPDGHFPYCGSADMDIGSPVIEFPSVDDLRGRNDLCSSGTPANISDPGIDNELWWECQGANGVSAECRAQKPVPAGVDPEPDPNCPDCGNNENGGGGWFWMCFGEDRPADAGECGLAVGQDVNPPYVGEELCLTGTPDLSVDTDPNDGVQTWVCRGTMGRGDSPVCSATQDPCHDVDPTRLAQLIGSIEATNGLAVIPSKVLCKDFASRVGDFTSTDGVASWDCDVGGETYSCTGYTPDADMPGSCGEAHGGSYFTTPPAEDLCDQGEVASLEEYESDSGQKSWVWTCEGQFGGENQQCQAFKIDTMCGSLSTEALRAEDAASIALPNAQTNPERYCDLGTPENVTKNGSSITWDCVMPTLATAPPQCNSETRESCEVPILTCGEAASRPFVTRDEVIAAGLCENGIVQFTSANSNRPVWELDPIILDQRGVPVGSHGYQSPNKWEWGCVLEEDMKAANNDPERINPNRVLICETDLIPAGCGCDADPGHPSPYADCTGVGKGSYGSSSDFAGGNVCYVGDPLHPAVTIDQIYNTSFTLSLHYDYPEDDADYNDREPINRGAWMWDCGQDHISYEVGEQISGTRSSASGAPRSGQGCGMTDGYNGNMIGVSDYDENIVADYCREKMQGLPYSNTSVDDCVSELSSEEIQAAICAWYGDCN